MPNRPAAPLVVTDSEADALRVLIRAGTTEQRTVIRAKVVLRAASGTPNEAIADELSISPTTVLLWRRRFESERLAGLGDASRSGRPPVYDRETRDRVIAET
jgi:transposase